MPLPPSRSPTIPGARRAASRPAYGVPSTFEKNVARTLSNPKGEPRTQHGRTPHHLLNGTITPNGLHFVISHSGDPDIDPGQAPPGDPRAGEDGRWSFTLDALAPLSDGVAHRLRRMRRQQRAAVLERAGPGERAGAARPGLLRRVDRRACSRRCSKKPASIPKAKWLIAEGADSLALSRSVPIAKALDDAMIALYQNGERLMPGNGYPMRLLLPGWEGNMNVKWLRRHQARRRAGDELLRVADLHADPAERKGVPVLLPAGGEVVHHPSRRLD